MKILVSKSDRICRILEELNPVFLIDKVDGMDELLNMVFDSHYDLIVLQSNMIERSALMSFIRRASEYTRLAVYFNEWEDYGFINEVRLARAHVLLPGIGSDRDLAKILQIVLGDRT